MRSPQETPKTDHPAATGSGTFQSGDEQGPTDLSPAREAAKVSYLSPPLHESDPER